MMGHGEGVGLLAKSGKVGEIGERGSRTVG